MYVGKNVYQIRGGQQALRNTSLDRNVLHYNILLKS